MTARRPSVSFASLFTLALAVGWSLSGACGGRSLSTSPDGGGAGTSAGAAGNGSAGTSPTGTGAAGSVGAAGAGTAGAAGVTGAAGAVTGAAGSTNTGAAGAAGNTGAAGVVGTAGTTGAAGSGAACGPCPDPKCKDGFMSVVDPAISCCPICRPLDCAAVDCAAPECPAGTHSEVQPGKCCPVCVKGVSQTCNQAQQSYESNRAAMLQKYGATPCKLDSECKIVVESNACVTNCGVALPVSNAGFFESNLEGYAAACDAACPPKPVPPCAYFAAVCSNGLCALVPGGAAP